MQVSVDRNLLKDSIGIVKTIQGTGQTNEWTKGLKFEALSTSEGNGTMKISATDITASIVLTIDASVSSSGKFLINGDLIQKMVECYVDDQVVIDTGEDISIKCGRDSGSYEAMRVDDFSDLTVDDNDSGWFQVPSSLIFDSDTKVRFAAADYTAAKPQMASVYLTLTDGLLEVVACDGCKLALLKTDISKDLPNFSILIPGETLAKICKAIKDYSTEADSTIDMNIKEDKLYLRYGRLLISGGLIDGKYINYKKIVPTNFTLGISFDRKELMRKIQIADIANSYGGPDKGINDIAMKINNEGFGQGFATIVNAKNVKNKQIGEIPFTTDYGEITEEWELWVDTKYALEVLKNSTNDVIQIDVDNPNVPFSIKGKDTDSYICVVMPKQHKTGKKES